jgi:hypothetical protein
MATSLAREMEKAEELALPHNSSRRTISRPRFSEQPLRELAHLRLASREPRFDDEMRTRSNQYLFERRDERTRCDEIADQQLTAQCQALAADRRLDHLLVLAEVKGAAGF